jgi:cobyrinic acid a,c-diamide synthase
MRPALIVSATHSGAGKTTATASIVRALRDSGLSVRPFKLGPDFIDGAYLAEAAGRPAVNLDLWMMGEDGVRSSFERWSADADIAVIEAMGALYDGADGGPDGSAAAMATLLGIPIVVVLDVWGMTRTAGALMLGLREFDPVAPIAGFLLNRVGGDRHREMIEAGLPEEMRRRIVGAIVADEELAVPERHLGLLTVEENAGAAHRREEAQRRAAGGLDLGCLRAVAEKAVRRQPAPDPGRGDPTRAAAAPPAPAASESHAASPAPRARLAVARDAAFCFYYEDNLRLLAEAGFELVPFSPIADPDLPDGTDAVYLGGGYPESFAPELAAGAELAGELRRRGAEGMPIYAECGGLLYLGRSLTDFDGRRHAMSGVLPFDAVMDPAHLSISYVEVRLTRDSPLGPAGTVARGQEFHQSRIVDADDMSSLYELTTSAGERREEGFVQGSVAGSYVHLHLASNPALAANLLRRAVAAGPDGRPSGIHSPDSQ